MINNMKILGKSGLSGLFEMMVSMLMVMGVLVMAMLPWLLDLYFKSYENFYDKIHAGQVKLMVLLYITGVLALVILFFAKNFLNSINQEKPFVKQNVSNMQFIALMCALISICYAVYIPILFSIFMVFMFLVFGMVTLVVLICAELFKQAVIFKEENELTI